MKARKIQNRSSEEQLFIYILFCAIFLSVVSIVGNLVIGFDFVLNYKWMVIILISLVALKLSFTKYMKHVQIVIFALIVFILLPFGWITSGGLNNFTIAYMFLICMAINYIFAGKLRAFFIFTLISVSMILLYVEYKYPDYIMTFEPEKHFRDMIIQIPLTLLAATYMLKKFADAYRREQGKMREYGRLLSEKNRSLEVKSTTDDLTGIYNRRYVLNMLGKMIKEAKSCGRVLSVVLIDVDNFKKINDAFGHFYGDKVLKKVCAMIRNSLREGDVIGRLGGDEFLIILPDTNQEQAAMIVERIRERVAQLKWEKDLTVTISGGVCQFNHEKIIDLLRAADTYLYQAKERGRNCIAGGVLVDLK